MALRSSPRISALTLRILNAAVVAASALYAGCGSDDPATSSAGGVVGTVDDYLAVPESCAYQCPGNDTCPEAKAPYQCPSLAAWPSIPHAPECPAWDGKYPTPSAGQCKATDPGGEAIKRPGPDASNPGTRILPDGRATKPFGKEWEFNETDVLGGATSALAAVAGTPYVITLDIGNGDHAVRAVDTSKIGSSDPVTGIVKFAPPMYLNSSVAVTASGTVYVATDFGVVQALAFDAATGALTKDDASSLALPPSGDGPFYVASVAASPDGKYLVVGSVEETRALVFDIDAASPTYKAQIGEVNVGDREVFGVYFDPFEPSGSKVYLSIWKGRKVVEVDLANPKAPKVVRSFTTDKNPQGIAFLDARWMVVANDLGETISLVDRASGAVTSVQVDFEPGLRGLDVSSVAYDAAAKRLYALLSGVNAVAAYDVDLTPDPPTLLPVGRLATAWWPSGLVVHPDSALTVVNLRGHEIGPLAPDADGDDLMRGSVQHIAAPSAADLTAGAASVAASINVGGRAGYPALDCPNGAADFPVPATTTEGPSSVIKHIIFVVRENKTFNTLLGDLPGVLGEPSYTMKATSDEMDKVWPNFRDLAKTFTMSDNFYNLAVKSTQGHHWTTYGRATDFCERTWSLDSRPVPLCGVSDFGRPEEGSLFEWLQKNKVVYDILGEVVGNPVEVDPVRNPVDFRYPGGPFQNITYVDIEKSCYTAARARVACNLGSFVYMTLPNDHTVGASPENPTPETMCAVNDEATGMLVDAISHSPLWASTLVVITEDDPQSGADSVDYHRTPLVLVSPWVKRGYVSKVHIDVASLHKLFAHILGLPYPNLLAKNAGLPLDMFTSTPDYTPFTMKPRAWPIACGSDASAAERELTDSWDFENVDDQPGLGEQVMRWMRGRQLQELTPRLKAEVAARTARRAKGLPPIQDDDD